MQRQRCSVWQRAAGTIRMAIVRCTEFEFTRGQDLTKKSYMEPNNARGHVDEQI
jgi:hypothetical protein